MAEDSSTGKEDEKREQTRKKLLRNCLVYPPINFFNPPEGKPADIIAKVLKKCQQLEEVPGRFLSWISPLLKEAKKGLSLIFFGRTIYGKDDDAISDVDIILFYPNSKIELSKDAANALSMSNKPEFVHVQSLWARSVIPFETTLGHPRFYVANSLVIYPKETAPVVCKSIEKGRKAIMESKFFNGGIGDLITYAAYNVMKNKEKEYFASSEEAEKILSKELMIFEYSFDMRAAMPSEINEQVRGELAKNFSKDELTTLAIAAMRRLNVKEERYKELSSRFVKNILKKR